APAAADAAAPAAADAAAAASVPARAQASREESLLLQCEHRYTTTPLLTALLTGVAAARSRTAYLHAEWRSQSRGSREEAEETAEKLLACRGLPAPFQQPARRADSAAASAAAAAAAAGQAAAAAAAWLGSLRLGE
ncbi:antifreeze protein Maxi-like, partial [Cyclospora cayetanensis]|uniref:Antifreeze protein Maxi-like n=1 Tax=Cyclospora cayetanensis TaxID=88456 RepID=A0A6P6S2Q0_9EIME